MAKRGKQKQKGKPQAAAPAVEAVSVAPAAIVTVVPAGVWRSAFSTRLTSA